MSSVTARGSRSPSPQDDGDHAADSSVRTPKDKECPFCHQAFTSSSLGRHLDLYIKSKNPKAPDGIHEVDKIREIRGKITRRQPRWNVKRQDHQSDTSEAGADSPPSTHTAQYGAPPPLSTASLTPHPSEPRSIQPRPTSAVTAPPAMGKRIENEPLATSTWGSPASAMRQPSEPFRAVFNATNWQSTGVITGLPAHAADMERFARARPHEAKLPPIRSDSLDHAQLEGEEIGRAAQLALKEVLDSLEAVRSREKPPTLWDFDYYGTTFPGLCLKLLPSPRLLFSVNPLSADDTWPLDPPGAPHLHALREAVTSHAAKLGFVAGSTEVQRSLYHLDTMYSAFEAQSEAQKQSVWRLETLRAYAKSQKRLAEKNTELRLARQHAEYFRQQFERLTAASKRSSATTPTSATLPSDPRMEQVYAQGAAGGSGPLTLSPEVAETLDHDVEARAWNYDRLITKWRRKLHDTPREPPSATQLLQHQHQQLATGNSPQVGSLASSGDSPATIHSGSPATGTLGRAGEREVRFLWDDGAGGRPRTSVGSSTTEQAPPAPPPISTAVRGSIADRPPPPQIPIAENERTDSSHGKQTGVPPLQHLLSQTQSESDNPGAVNENGKRARPTSWREDTRMGGADQ